MKLALFILLSGFTLASASQDASKLFEKCATCHGEHGEKHSLNVTKYIAGMDKDDVVEILHMYKKGERNKYGLGTMMKGQASKLTDEQMAILGEYISNFPKVEVKEITKEAQVVLDGKEIFKRCAVCHGPQAHKRSLGKSKYIAGMEKQHIIDTLHGYQAGKINQYGFGSMMKGQVTKLTEKQLNEVASYIESLPKKSEDAKDETPVVVKKKKSSHMMSHSEFMDQYFKNSKNPNETFAQATKKWQEYKAKMEKEKMQDNNTTK